MARRDNVKQNPSTNSAFNQQTNYERVNEVVSIIPVWMRSLGRYSSNDLDFRAYISLQIHSLLPVGLVLCSSCHTVPKKTLKQALVFQ